MFYDVFIPTAGLGTRLEELSKNQNKSLLPINHKPVISHIIEKFPHAKVFHIAIGFKGELVKDYLEIAYPKKNFNFIKIKNFSGKGSGLGLTLANSVNHFDKPFYFVSCDTFIDNKIKFKNFNWLGISNRKDFSNNYRHLRIKNNNVSKILEKKEIKKKDDKVYIGLAFIKNFLDFKETFKQNKKNILKLGEVAVLRSMIEKNINFKIKKLNWYDTGNKNDYLKLKKKKDDKDINILYKPNEAIWFVNQKVIKFSLDKKFIKNRIIRSTHLRNYVPKIIKKKNNFYSYKYVKGKLFSKVKDIQKFKSLLETSKKFWITKKFNPTKYKKFTKSCDFFYKKKTIERINKFYNQNNIKDRNYIINGKKIENCDSLLKKIDWDFLKKGIPSSFHGDYHFENIIFDNLKKKFTFLDWRQDFNGDLQYGDLYYDLAKLMHGLIVSHEVVLKDKFKIDKKKDIIKVGIYRKPYLIRFENYFCKWIKLNNFSLKKVYLLTSLIYLNIAALHHTPYNKFLYFFGLYMLNNSMQIKNDTK